MNLMKIETNKGRAIDGGFRHTVFKCTRVNGDMMYELVESCKFNEVLTETDHLEGFRKDPQGFIKSLSDE